MRLLLVGSTAQGTTSMLLHRRIWNWRLRVFTITALVLSSGCMTFRPVTHQGRPTDGVQVGDEVRLILSSGAAVEMIVEASSETHLLGSEIEVRKADVVGVEKKKFSFVRTVGAGAVGFIGALVMVMVWAAVSVASKGN